MAVPLMKAKYALGVAEEATYGTAETINAGTATLKVYEPNMNVVKAAIERAAQNKLGRDIAAVGAKSTTLSFTSHIQGHGGSGVPNWFTLAKACGFALSGSTLTSTSTTSGWKSISTGHYIDGRRYLGRGMMGTATMTFPAGSVATAAWNFQGGYVADPADVALVTGTYEAVVPPVFDGAASLTIGGATTYLVGTVTLDLGNEVALREDANSDGGYIGAWIGNKTPTLTLDPEAVTVATKDWYGAQDGSSNVDIVLVLNGGTNNTLTFTFNDCALRQSPEPGDRNGKLVDSLGFDITGDIVIVAS